MKGMFFLLFLLNAVFTFSQSLYKIAQMYTDSTIIDPTQLDTALYSSHYKLMGIYDLYNPGFDGKLTLGDFNNNGFSEIYCTQYNPHFSPAKIFEFDSTNNLNLVYTYPHSSTIALTSYDINADGHLELVINSPGSFGIYVYKSPVPNSYPTDLSFMFSIGPDYQVDHSTFCDADKDGNTDYIFVAPTGSGWLYIYEYDSLQNNFVQKYVGDEPFYAGFLVNDFDLDVENEIIGGHIDGYVEILQCTGDDKYGEYLEFRTEIINAYQLFTTDDFNNDGLPEFWLGGDDFQNNSFKFICFEKTNNDNLKRITSISFRYLGAYPYGYVTAKDFDNDGVEEIFVDLNTHMFILKYNGDPDNPKFDVKYFGIIESENPTLWVDNVTLYDIYDRGKYEILVSLLEGDNNDYFKRTYIYTPDIPTEINPLPEFISSYFLHQNYPNPFNPITTINYEVPQRFDILLKVYDILGKEVLTLVNSEKPAGRYSVKFDGSNLPSGVYFYQLKATSTGGQASSFIETKKMILLR